MPTADQKQHVDIHRKLLLRRSLMRYAPPGAAYVPFCGDGDISEIYSSAPRFKVYGADIDPARVATASKRFPAHTFKTADCNEWPFRDVTAAFTLGDFDAYSHPYTSFEAFWTHARYEKRLVLFFTDVHRQGIIRAGVLIQPDGTKRKLDNLTERRKLFHAYLVKIIKPWFYRFIEPWRVRVLRSYIRGGMIYWGSVITRE